MQTTQYSNSNPPTPTPTPLPAHGLARARQKQQSVKRQVFEPTQRLAYISIDTTQNISLDVTTHITAVQVLTQAHETQLTKCTTLTWAVIKQLQVS